MSSFFNQLRQVSNTDAHNTHSVPTPGDMAALYSVYSRGLSAEAAAHATTPTLALMQEIALAAQDEPPREVRGVRQEVVDGLERVDRKALGPDETCAICAERFLDDRYALVVELPCAGRHRFDLECIAPWLLLEGTCPMDRERVGERKEKVVVVEDEEEEEWDDMYA